MLRDDAMERAAFDALGSDDWPAEAKPARAAFGPVDLGKALLESGERFAVDAGGALYYYESGAYRPGGLDHVRRRAKDILALLRRERWWSANRCDEAARWLACDAPRLWERPSAEVLNLRNGLLDVDKRELRPHSPEHTCSVQLPIRFDPAARCVAWEGFIESTFPEDSQELPYRIAAWLMLPMVSIQKAVLCTGSGANGKSVFLQALTAFLGPWNVSNVSLQKLEADRFSVARLIGKLANICPDLPSTDLESTSIFKSIVGGDRLMAERKYADAFEVTPFARLIFSANHPPKSRDASEAFFRRWLVVPFERVFTEGGEGWAPREELDAALAHHEEQSGLLNRALEYVGDLRESGLGETGSTLAAFQEFRATTDPFAAWLDSRTVKDPSAWIPAGALWEAYRRACEEAGRPFMSKQAMGRVIRRIRPELLIGQRDGADAYLGIRWQDEPVLGLGGGEWR
jgi:putative DNA primase/helicase